MKTTRSSIALASWVNNNKVVSDGSSDSSRSNGLIGKSIKSSQNLKSKNLVKPSNSKAMEESRFLTFEAKKIFNHLK